MIIDNSYGGLSLRGPPIQSLTEGGPRRLGPPYGYDPTDFPTLVIQVAVDDFAAGPRAQGPESAALRAVRGNTMDEMHGAVGEEEVDSARMIAGEIVQPSVGVGGNVDPIVMDQDECLSGTRGIRPDIGLAGPTDGPVGRASPNAIGLHPSAVAQ